MPMASKNFPKTAAGRQKSVADSMKAAFKTPKVGHTRTDEEQGEEEETLGQKIARGLKKLKSGK